MAFIAGAHLRGRAGLAEAPEPDRVNKSGNKAAGRDGLNRRWLQRPDKDESSSFTMVLRRQTRACMYLH